MLADYFLEFANEHRKETSGQFKNTSNTKIITSIIPTIIQKFLKNDNFKVYGSVGSGNWSEIPWIAILDKAITPSTTKGYYIVFLFDKELQDIYLCLGVGWTQFEEEFGIKEGLNQIKATCKYYALNLNIPTGFTNDVIKLHAENNLGKGYEAGSIISKKYSIKNLTDQIIFDDISKLIETYKELKSTVGNSILNIGIDTSNLDQNITGFRKRIAAESFSKIPSKAIQNLIEIANAAPPDIREKLKKEIVRNRKFALFVKERADYICEICSKKPFMQKNGKPYAEADHVNQLGGGVKGLDSPDNMRCLCAQCHAVITYGTGEEILKLNN